MLTNAPHHETLHIVPLLDAHRRHAQVQQVVIWSLHSEFHPDLTPRSPHRAVMSGSSINQNGSDSLFQTSLKSSTTKFPANSNCLPKKGTGAGSVPWEQVHITKCAITACFLFLSKRRDTSSREAQPRSMVIYSYTRNTTHSEQKTKEIRFAKG